MHDVYVSVCHHLSMHCEQVCACMRVCVRVHMCVCSCASTWEHNAIAMYHTCRHPCVASERVRVRVCMYMRMHLRPHACVCTGVLPAYTTCVCVRLRAHTLMRARMAHRSHAHPCTCALSAARTLSLRPAPKLAAHRRSQAEKSAEIAAFAAKRKEAVERAEALREQRKAQVRAQ